MEWMKEMEEDNRCLKKMYVEERLKAEIVVAALTRKGRRYFSHRQSLQGMPYIQAVGGDLAFAG